MLLPGFDNQMVVYKYEKPDFLTTILSSDMVQITRCRRETSIHCMFNVVKKEARYVPVSILLCRIYIKARMYLPVKQRYALLKPSPVLWCLVLRPVFCVHVTVLLYPKAWNFTYTCLFLFVLHVSIFSFDFLFALSQCSLCVLLRE